MSAQGELARILQSPTWQALLDDAVHLEAELEIVLKEGGRIVSGSIDLLTESKDGLLRVVDYKTTLFAADAAGSLSDLQLIELCRQRGYLGQIKDYARAVKAMHRGSPVIGSVLFTSLGRLVDLCSY